MSTNYAFITEGPSNFEGPSSNEFRPRLNFPRDFPFNITQAKVPDLRVGEGKGKNAVMH